MRKRWKITAASARVMAAPGARVVSVRPFISPAPTAQAMACLLYTSFFAGVERHVPEYETMWHDLLRHLAIGVNNIRMVLDCDVVLGG